MPDSDDGGWASEPDVELDGPGSTSNPREEEAAVTQEPGHEHGTSVGPADGVKLNRDGEVEEGEQRARLKQIQSLHWVQHLLEYFKTTRESLRSQTRKVVLDSGCTGMWTEGFAASAFNAETLHQNRDRVRLLLVVPSTSSVVMCVGGVVSMIVNTCCCEGRGFATRTHTRVSLCSRAPWLFVVLLLQCCLP
jgi:hypothetical protein